MFYRLRKLIMAPFLLILSACGLARCMPAPLDGPMLDALYATPLPAPDGPKSAVTPWALSSKGVSNKVLAPCFTDKTAVRKLISDLR